MRRISNFVTFGFLFFITVVGIVSYLIPEKLFSLFTQERGFLFGLSVVVVFYTITIPVYRILGKLLPEREGLFPENSWEEHLYNFRTWFHLLPFYPLTHARILPPPMTRPLYRALGCHIGFNSYPSASFIGNPYELFSAGDHVIFGANSVITTHIMEAGKLGVGKIQIGNRVTIGTLVAILPDVIIGDGAVIAAGAVVQKGSRIGENEIWGGVPARKIGMVNSPAHQEPTNSSGSPASQN